MADITSNMILWYKLNETATNTAADSSGSGNNGTYTNSPTKNVQGNTGNRAVTFLTANNHYITGPNIATASTNNVTYAAWIKPSGNQAAFAAVIFSRTSVCGLTFSLEGVLRIGYTWNNDALTYNWIAGPSITNNVWTHVVVAIQPTKADVYINGSLSATNTTSHAGVVNPFANIRICSDSFSTGRNFNGTLDDVFIFNRTLSAGDALALKNWTEPYSSIFQTPAQTVTGATPSTDTISTYPYLFRSRTL